MHDPTTTPKSRTALSAPVAEILAQARARFIEGQRTHVREVFLGVGLDPSVAPRGGGPEIQVVLAALRAEGYTVDVDGRSCELKITIDNGLHPVPSRREAARVDLNDDAIAGEMAIEAIDALASALRNPIADTRRHEARLRQLEASMTTALEALPGDAVKAPIEVIMHACELGASEAAVLADILIAVKPALARACGVSTFG